MKQVIQQPSGIFTKQLARTIPPAVGSVVTVFFQARLLPVDIFGSLVRVWNRWLRHLSVAIRSHAFISEDSGYEPHFLQVDVQLVCFLTGSRNAPPAATDAGEEIGRTQPVK